jgi:hypothetical protein
MVGTRADAFASAHFATLRPLKDPNLGPGFHKTEPYENRGGRGQNQKIPHVHVSHRFGIAPHAAGLWLTIPQWRPYPAFAGSPLTLFRSTGPPARLPSRAATVVYVQRQRVAVADRHALSLTGHRRFHSGMIALLNKP